MAAGANFWTFCVFIEKIYKHTFILKISIRRNGKMGIYYRKKQSSEALVSGDFFCWWKGWIRK